MEIPLPAAYIQSLVISPFPQAKGNCSVLSLDRLVEADRVHRTVYTDQAIFDREMQQIWDVAVLETRALLEEEWA